MFSNDDCPTEIEAQKREQLDIREQSRDPLFNPTGATFAMGGDLTLDTLVSAYAQGIFPWFNDDQPILWWSPDPRCIIWPNNIKVSRSLRKTIRNGHFEVTENFAYREIMRRCGAPRKGSTGTWITDEMLAAYCHLNTLGIARSLEVWMGHQLVGGLYGIQMGRVFVGESMFSTERDASKVALVHLAQSGKYKLIDCQLETPHLNSMGATSIKREHYLQLLNEYGDFPTEMPDHESLRSSTA